MTAPHIIDPAGMLGSSVPHSGVTVWWSACCLLWVRSLPQLHAQRLWLLAPKKQTWMSSLTSGVSAPAKRSTGTHPSNASNCCSGHNPACNHP